MVRSYNGFKTQWREEQATGTQNNMDAFQKSMSVKEASCKREHTVCFPLYGVAEIKTVVTSEVMWGGTGWKRAGRELSGWWQCSLSLLGGGYVGVYIFKNSLNCILNSWTFYWLEIMPQLKKILERYTMTIALSCFVSRINNRDGPFCHEKWKCKGNTSHSLERICSQGWSSGWHSGFPWLHPSFLSSVSALWNCA